MNFTPAERHYIQNCLPESGSLKESIVLADLRPKLAWTAAEVAKIPDTDDLTTHVLNQSIEAKEIELSEEERKVIGQGFVLMEANKGKTRDLPSSADFASVIRKFEAEIEAAQN